MNGRLLKERSPHHSRRMGKFGPLGVIRKRSELLGCPDRRKKLAALKAARDLYMDIMCGMDL